MNEKKNHSIVLLQGTENNQGTDNFVLTYPQIAEFTDTGVQKLTFKRRFWQVLHLLLKNVLKNLYELSFISHLKNILDLKIRSVWQLLVFNGFGLVYFSENEVNKSVS